MTRLLTLRIWTPMLVLAMLAASCGTESTDTSSPTATEAPATTTTVAATGHDHHKPPPQRQPAATTTSILITGEPSQSVADAQRDGIVPELAALPIELRVDPVFELRAAEGVWVLSRPHDDVWR